MRTKIAIALTTLASFGGFAAQANAEPIVTVCGSVKVTVNGEAVVSESACQGLLPETH